MDEKIFTLKKRTIFIVLIFHIGFLFLVGQASKLVESKKNNQIQVKTILVKALPQVNIQDVKSYPNMPISTIMQEPPKPIAAIKNEVIPAPQVKKEEKPKIVPSEPKIKKVPTLEKKKIVKKTTHVKPQKPIARQSPVPKKKTASRSVASQASSKKMVPRKVHSVKNFKEELNTEEDSSYVSDHHVKKIMQDIEGHFEKIDQVHLQQDAKETAVSVQNETTYTPNLQSLEIDANFDFPISSSENIDLKQRLIMQLKEDLQLPDYGEVKALITISKEGKVMSVKILSTQNEKNSAYLKNSLPKESFPWFNVGSSQENSFEFYITFKNE
jgi:hypothetical protein